MQVYLGFGTDQANKPHAKSDVDPGDYRVQSAYTPRHSTCWVSILHWHEGWICGSVEAGAKVAGFDSQTVNVDED